MIQNAIVSVLGNHIRSLSKRQDDTVWLKVVRKDNTPKGYDWQIRFGEKPQDHGEGWSIGWPISSETDMVWQLGGCLIADALKEWGHWGEWSPKYLKAFQLEHKCHHEKLKWWMCASLWYDDFEEKDVEVISE